MVDPNSDEEGLASETDALPLADAEAERLRRWRLLLGGAANESCGGLGQGDAKMDQALEQLYDAPGWRNEEKSSRNVGLGASSPQVARWLGDIRSYFPSSVVQLMQQDAFVRLGLHQLLLEPEMLECVVPDVHLVGTLLSMNRVIPAKTKETARLVVRKVVENLEKKLKQKTVATVRGALDRANRNRRPRSAAEMNWDRTLRANLHTYDKKRKVVIAEKLIGHSRKQRRGNPMRDIVLCVDQSGSMATSVVYAGIFGAVLASLRAVHTRIIFYDTEVVDLTEKLADPVDVLFGAQLGGGNDTPRALTYCQQVISRPAETILVLISDLYEGDLSAKMLARAAELKSSGVNMICLLALSDDGRPSYDPSNASAFADLGIPTFACTPDLFPDLMAAAIERKDLGQWAAKNEINLAKRMD